MIVTSSWIKFSVGKKCYYMFETFCPTYCPNLLVYSYLKCDSSFRIFGNMLDSKNSV